MAMSRLSDGRLEGERRQDQRLASQMHFVGDVKPLIGFGFDFQVLLNSRNRSAQQHVSGQHLQTNVIVVRE